MTKQQEREEMGRDLEKLQATCKEMEELANAFMKRVSDIQALPSDQAGKESERLANEIAPTLAPIALHARLLLLEASVMRLNVHMCTSMLEADSRRSAYTAGRR